MTPRRASEHVDLDLELTRSRGRLVVGDLTPPERLAAVLARAPWRPRPDGAPVRWTDDRSSVVGVLRW